ncbi:hypothetical protein BaRGS_00007075 [Batillaria attramentaria]|uniref:Uncharacterized protein n=1 Tax=Batillaria attramentaria TaxID=370345 RepID=A0ABD0LQ47_9CAEN
MLGEDGGAEKAMTFNSLSLMSGLVVLCYGQSDAWQHGRHLEQAAFSISWLCLGDVSGGGSQSDEGDISNLRPVLGVGPLRTAMAFVFVCLSIITPCIKLHSGYRQAYTDLSPAQPSQKRSSIA